MYTVEQSAAERPVPVVSEQEKSVSTANIQTLQAELEKSRDAEARLLAEFCNYRRRAEAELAAARQRAHAEVLAQLADTVGALELAQASSQGDPEAIREGVALIARRLESVFQAHGLSRIETVGRRFNPRLHEAVSTEQVDDVAEGTIVRELSPGFARGEDVIRPAKVSVAT